MTENTEFFRFRTQVSKTSQRGRLFKYLNGFDKIEKQFRVMKAIENYYLVEALESEGIREREDIKKIGYRCVAELKAQVETIERSLGIESSKAEERPYYFSQPQQFQPMAASIEQSSSKPEPEPQLEEEEDDDEYDYENDPGNIDLSKFEMSEEEEKKLLEDFMNSL